MHRSTLLVLLACLLGGRPLPAQVVVYSFGTAATPTTAAASTATSLTAGSFASLAGNGATGSGSPVYASGSGGAYFTASTWTGSAPGANYFEFTLTPAAGHSLSITSLSLGYRATSSGPTTLALRSSADGFGTNLASAALTNDGAWHTYGSGAVALSGLTTSTVLRLYASGASGSVGTLRVDDVAVYGALAAVPEPGTAAAIAGGIALVGGLLLRRRRRAPSPAAPGK